MTAPIKRLVVGACIAGICLAAGAFVCWKLKSHAPATNAGPTVQPASPTRSTSSPAGSPTVSNAVVRPVTGSMRTDVSKARAAAAEAQKRYYEAMKKQAAESGKGPGAGSTNTPPASPAKP